MVRFLMFTLIIALVITGLMLYSLDNYLEKEIERAIYAGYPGTHDVQVEVNIKWTKEGLKGQIEKLRLDIVNWSYDNWHINSFKGRLNGVKINWIHLLRKKQLVVEEIAEGTITAEIDSANLNKLIGKHYSGIGIKLEEDQVAIDLTVSILGRKLTGTAYGSLIPAEGPGVVFMPARLLAGGLELNQGLQDKILKNLRFQFLLEKLPFTFQVTTVKIMDNKILIQGKV
ncbi:MAG: LmeA family phospholipid-binding protein [Bacillota bacterium]